VLPVVCRDNLDLNRAFPDRSTSPDMTSTGKEPFEVLAIMKFATSFPFSAGCNMHEGAIVANYPWDSDKDIGSGYAAAPDDKAFLHLAETFAGLHATMSKQHGLPARFDGIAVRSGGLTPA
jgi:carboxypeptidase D